MHNIENEAIEQFTNLTIQEITQGNDTIDKINNNQNTKTNQQS